MSTHAWWRGPARGGASLLGAALLAVAATASAPAAEGTLVVAVNQEPQDLAAQGAYKEINAPGLRNVIETLIAADPVSGKFRGVLATDWEVVDDRTIRMNLRRGVTFHDGTPFDAESAAFASGSTMTARRAISRMTSLSVSRLGAWPGRPATSSHSDRMGADRTIS